MVLVLLSLHHSAITLPAGQRNKVPSTRQKVQHQHLRLLQTTANSRNPLRRVLIDPLPSNQIKQQSRPGGEAGLQDPAEVLRPVKPIPVDPAVEAKAIVI